MIENDTIRLLRVCDSGVKMGLLSINDVVNQVEDDKLAKTLKKSREKHEKLDGEINKILAEYHDDGKEPGTMARGMSWIKTGVKMAVDPSDATIADLMTDGCHMGCKSLQKYLNEYPAAENRVKHIAEELIEVEEEMGEEMKEYLR